MNHSIFDPKNKVKIIKESGTYPHDNNCYHVRVSCPGFADESTEFDIHFLPKAEYELAMQLRALSKILRKDELERIKKLIEDFGDHRYQEALDSAAQDVAQGDF